MSCWLVYSSMLSSVGFRIHSDADFPNFYVIIQRSMIFMYTIIGKNSLFVIYLCLTRHHSQFAISFAFIWKNDYVININVLSLIFLKRNLEYSKLASFVFHTVLVLIWYTLQALSSLVPLYIPPFEQSSHLFFVLTLSVWAYALHPNVVTLCCLRHIETLLRV